MPAKKKKNRSSRQTEVLLAGGEHHFVKKSLDIETASRVQAAGRQSEAEADSAVKDELKPRGHSAGKRAVKSSDAEARVARELLAIYENGDGTLPDMKTFEKRESGGAAARSLWALSAVIFASAAALLWQAFYSSAPSLAETDVALSLSGPETATIGEEVTYRVRYHAADDTSLAKTSLELLYPAGFVFATSSRPAATESGTAWKLGDIKVNESGYIDITGRLFGNINEEQSFRALFNYTPGNFNSEFQKTASASVMLNKSPVELLAAGPAKVAAGDEARIDMKLTRPAEGSWPITLVFEPGMDFAKKGSTPESDPNQPYRWSFPLDVASPSVSLNGSFGSESAGVATNTVRVVSRVPGRPEAPSFSLVSQTLPIQIVAAPLSARLVINGEADKGAIAPGSLLSANIIIKNSGAETVRHLRVRLMLDAPSANSKSLLNWNKLSEPRNGEVVGEQLNETTRRGMITWTEKVAPELAELAPGAEVALDLSLPLKSGQETSLVNYTTSEITAVVDAQYDGAGAPELRQGNTVRLTLNSDLSLDVSDEIKKGESGENHRIAWLLRNSFHELKDVAVSADIFGDLVWDESALSAPAGSVVFDAAAKRLTWKVPALTTETDALALEFAVTLKQKNPTQTKLTSPVRVTAVDTVTGQTITFAAEEILLLD